MVLHEVAAQITGVREVQLTSQQSDVLSTAIVECADAWGWNPVSDPRLVSSLTLAGVAFAIYAPKVKAVKSQLKNRKVLTGPENGHNAQES